MKLNATFPPTVFMLTQILLASFVGSLLGTDVQWNSSLFADNRDSLNTTLNREWTFYLGYFSAGFSPASSNTEEWESRWTTVDSVRYIETGSRYSGLWANDGSATGKSAWVWGVKRQDTTNEWILLRSSAWTFPAPGGLGFPVNWAAGSATEVVVGSVNQGGVHLRTQQVAGEPPRLTYSLWQKENFTPSELQGGLIAKSDFDEDGDGSSNLQEYAFGTDPRKNSSRPLAQVSLSVTGQLEFTVSRLRNGVVDYFPQVSSDLVTWDEGSVFVSLQSSPPNLLYYRDKSSAAPRFGRVRVELR